MSLTYVIPDVHGRYDLLCEGLSDISAHSQGSAGVIVMLGDYVDKGPDSKQVIDRLLSGVADGWNLVALKGGDAALASYGRDPAAVPQSHIAWLDQLRLMHVDTHRLYVHAGVDPDISLARQNEATLLWKRYPKGFSGGFGELHVVHGHDNFPEGPLLYQGRTNLDTLAWRTGRLTIGVFDDDRPGGPIDFIEVRGPSAGR